ncbi:MULTISPECIES: hypothetical protein [unclassified Streptomyces]|uniref:hypothetical protein n=1 Tax=unclassified Streptomyces TaxID=2593676 RepID=UPI0033297A0D
MADFETGDQPGSDHPRLPSIALITLLAGPATLTRHPEYAFVIIVVILVTLGWQGRHALP